MTWIRVDTNLSRHPKVTRLAGGLKISRHAALGLLIDLWTWAMEYAEDGDLSPYSDGELEVAVGLESLPLFAETPLLEALQAAGFVDHDQDGTRLHNWEQYAGVLLEQRAKHTRRQSLYRDKDLRAAVRVRDRDRCRYCDTEVKWTDRRGAGGGTYDHVDPDGPNTEENLVVACRSCNSTKGDRAPEDAGLTLRPAPDLPPTYSGPTAKPALRTNERTERTNVRPSAQARAGRESKTRSGGEPKSIGEVLDGLEGPIAEQIRGAK